VASDAVSVIMQDHRVLEGLFEKCKKNRSDRSALVAEIKARLQAHSRAEEERVYPALAKADPDEADEVHHGVEEHREAELKLARLEGTDPESEEFDSALEEFVSAVKHHVEEEESEILPSLKDAVDKSRLEELGTAFEGRRKEILGRAGLEKAGSDSIDPDEMTKAELYEKAKEADIPGRSRMTKDELARELSG
jgi:hemerythrin superfamily protein